MYKCVNCKKVVAKLKESIKCPYCGYRIFIKLRPETIKRVRSR